MGYEGNYPTPEEYASYSDEDRKRFAEDFYRGGYAYAGYKPTLKAKLKYKFGKTLYVIAYPLALLLLFAVLNGVVIGGQELWHLKQKHDLSQLQNEMNNTKEIIQSFEAQVDAGTISDSDYQLYEKQIDQYNADAAKHNELNEKIGTTWYIIPFPHGK